MANIYKVLGQSNPAATTLTSLYTVPATTSAVASTLTVCNIGVSTTVRVAVRPAGAGIANQHYIIYDVAVNSNDTLFFTLGLSLATTDVVSVYAGSANVSFNLYGTEIT
jgi:hypothetical protein